MCTCGALRLTFSSRLLIGCESCWFKFATLRLKLRRVSADRGRTLLMAVGIPMAYALGCRVQWPRPLLGVWLGNVGALSFAALWVLLIVATKVIEH